MTYREYIMFVGYDKFHTIINGIYSEEFVMSKDGLLDCQVNRYMLWADKPFYVVFNEYRRCYSENMDIGAMWDWLDDYPTEEEIKSWKASYKFRVRYRGCYKVDDSPDANDDKVGTIEEWTIGEILEEINRDRSGGWEDFNETDWREGLAEWTWYEPID